MMSAVLDLPLASVRTVPGKNPRAISSYAEGSDEGGREESSLAELAESMRALGQLHPIGVRQDGEGYAIVYGHRRRAAAERIGWTTIRCALVEGDAADDAYRAIAENVGPKKLHAVELAKAIRGLSGDARGVASKTGLSVRAVQRYRAIGQRLERQIFAAWERAPGAFRVHDLAAVAQRSPEDQSAWYLAALGMRERPEVAKIKKPRKLRPAEVARMLRRGELPEIDVMTGREAALAALELLKEKIG